MKIGKPVEIKYDKGIVEFCEITKKKPSIKSQQSRANQAKRDYLDQQVTSYQLGSMWFDNDFSWKEWHFTRK